MMPMRSPTILVFLLGLIGNFSPIEGLKILVFVPGYSNSHILFNYRFSSALTNKGHSVTLWTMLDWPLEKTNLNPPPEVEEHRVLIDLPSRGINGHLSLLDEFAFKVLGFADYRDIVKKFRLRFRVACEIQMDQEPLIKKLSNRGFDLVLSHGFDMCPMILTNLMGLGEKFTFVTPGTFILDSMAHILGLPTAPSYIPNSIGRSSDRMTFMDRATNTFWLSISMTVGEIIGSLLTDEEFLFRGPPHGDRPTFKQLWQSIPSLFINGEPFLDFPRPLPFGISYLGELGEQTKIAETKERELDQKFVDILERADKGAILFSLGTIAKAKHMPDWMRRGFAEAFTELKGYEVIWRFDGEVPEVAGIPHIHVVKWLPQRDLLNHPKMKLFVTHGGFNSLLEATKAGVPLVMIPLFFDQYGNGARARRHGLGVVIDKMAVSKESMLEAMTKVLENDQYTIRAKSLAKTLGDRVVGPGILLDHRVKFLATKRNQFPTLYRAQTLSFWRYHCLDVLSLFLLVVIAFSIAVFRSLRSCLRIIEGADRKKRAAKRRNKGD